MPNHSGSETFDEVYWDDAQDRREYSGSERTWDESTYATEWTNNSILCVRDLVENTRYGLGNYLTTDDIYDAGLISIMFNPGKEGLL